MNQTPRSPFNHPKLLELKSKTGSFPPAPKVEIEVSGTKDATNRMGALEALKEMEVSKIPTATTFNHRNATPTALEEYLKNLN